MEKRLHQSCIDNALAFWTATAQTATNGMIIEQDGIYSTISGLNSGMLNAIFKFDLNQISYEQIKDKIKKHYPSPDFPISFWLQEGSPIEDKIFFESCNLQFFGQVPIMLSRTDNNLPSPNLNGIEIMPYQNSDLSEWIKPFCHVFGLEEMSTAMQQILEKLSDKMHHFVAICNDQIVATASIFTGGGEFAGFYNLATLPEYRNRGIATALHSARLKFAAQLGYQYATLQATPMATHLDSSLGFQPVTAFDIYLDKL